MLVSSNLKTVDETFFENIMSASLRIDESPASCAQEIKGKMEDCPKAKGGCKTVKKKTRSVM